MTIRPTYMAGNERMHWTGTRPAVCPSYPSTQPVPFYCHSTFVIVFFLLFHNTLEPLPSAVPVCFHKSFKLRLRSWPGIRRVPSCDLIPSSSPRALAWSRPTALLARGDAGIHSVKKPWMWRLWRQTLVYKPRFGGRRSATMDWDFCRQQGEKNPWLVEGRNWMAARVMTF